MVDWREVEIGGTVNHNGVLYRKISGVFGVADDGEMEAFGRWQDVDQVGKPPKQTQGDLFEERS